MRVQSYLYLNRCAGFVLCLAVGLSSPKAALAAPVVHGHKAAPAPKHGAQAGGSGKQNKAAHKMTPPAVSSGKALHPVAPPGAGAHAPAAPLRAPALDLSAPVTEQDARAAERARQEILGTPVAAPKQRNKATIDFGSGIDLGNVHGGKQSGEVSFDFSTDDALEFNLTQDDTYVAQRRRLEEAMGMMADESYDKAAIVFRACLTDPNFVNFIPEVEYQLARALYKLGFYAASHARFQQILQVGPSHRRFHKAVEWLFFMSRKVADQELVLAELAKFRNVTFPKAYHDEYDYLLAKYLFVQANALEMRRLQDEELMHGKQAKENTIDFAAVATAIAGEKGSRGQASTLDFSNLGSALDFGSTSTPAHAASGLDFAAPPANGGALDFGAAASPAAAPTESGALDFGATPPQDTLQPSMPTTTAEAVKQGLELVAQIATDSAFYAQAKYLEGLLHYLGGSEQQAVEAFQETIRLLGPKDPTRADPRLREMAFLSLARIHFGHKQFNRSAYYYDLIDRDSENWLTALFESSWAYYQRGDYEKALGNLLTLHSPFFEREYFPESQIVRATIYFEGCRYAETRTIVDEFIPRYTRLLHEVQKVAESEASSEVIYNQVMQLAAADTPQKQKDDTSVRVLNLMLRSPEIQTAQAAVAQVNEERRILSKGLSSPFRHSVLGNELTLRLEQEAQEATGHAGEVIKQKFEQEMYKLKSLLGQALRIKIEVARSERDILEARSHDEAAQNEVIAATSRTVVDDEHLFWPYEGEYWRDELGTYELDFSMCRRLGE